MKMVKKLSALLLAVILLASLGVSAFAVDVDVPDVNIEGPNSSFSYTPVYGSTTTFNKYLVMDVGDNVPNATFSFTVAAGTAIPASEDSFEVYAGVFPERITITDAVFGPNDATSSTETEATNGKKHAAQTVTINFNPAPAAPANPDEPVPDPSLTGVYFKEPGIYRYIITETANADHASAGIIHDSAATRVLDVYVTDKNDGTNTLQIDNYILHTQVGNVDISTETLSDKSDGFTNEYNAKDLKIEKEVSGNLASRDKFFKLTVTMTDVADDDVFTVSLADDNNAHTNDGSADANTGSNSPATKSTYLNQANPTSVTGAQLKAGVNFYLQHGDSVVIRGLPINATYTVTEDAEDYTSSVMTGKTNSGVIGTVAGTNKMAQAGFTNTREGTVPTGVLLTVIPGVVIVLLAAFGLVLVLRRKKNNT